MKYYITSTAGSKENKCREATPEEVTAQEEKNRAIMEIEDPRKWLEAMKEAAFIIAIGGTK